ncbi:hypothetical protein [Streptomyces violaceusniger]|uniref:Uncharacterized protein n=1 Tax=Streptomyces violaceusniger TaxID=68280 RepID=A0A4D4LFK2_STRVO|nr:hypothetical protein SVIO_106850 [Streptomyces violaceusniger]
MFPLGKVAGFLCAAEPEPAERAVLDQGVTVRRGQDYTLRISAIPAVHRRLSTVSGSSWRSTGP